MTTASVTLDVRDFAATSGDGYKNTVASNGATYSYKYSGGTDSNGGVEVVTGTGTLTLTVTVNADPRYVIGNVAFANDVGDLSWARISGYIAVITDTDLDNENAYYSVLIVDNGAGSCTLPCDPPIINKKPN